MKNIKTINFQDYFDNHFGEDLNRTDLIELSKQDNGALNNVIAFLAENCFGKLQYMRTKSL